MKPGHLVTTKKRHVVYLRETTSEHTPVAEPAAVPSPAAGPSAQRARWRGSAGPAPCRPQGVGGGASRQESHTPSCQTTLSTLGIKLAAQRPVLLRLQRLASVTACWMRIHSQRCVCLLVINVPPADDVHQILNLNRHHLNQGCSRK